MASPVGEEASLFVGAGILEPPYDPLALCILFEHSNALRQNLGPDDEAYQAARERSAGAVAGVPRPIARRRRAATLRHGSAAARDPIDAEIVCPGEQERVPRRRRARALSAPHGAVRPPAAAARRKSA